MATGNTTVTGFINVSSYGTFNGTVNATSINVGANLNLTTTHISIGNATQNTAISSNNIILNGTFTANSSNGTSGQVLTSSGATGNAYWSTVSSGGGTSLTANNTDSQTFYLPMSNTTSGSWSNGVVSTTKLSFIPSSGVLTAPTANLTSSLNVVGAATVNGALTVNNTAALGNTTVTGFVNASSYGTFGGTVNAASLNVSGVTGSGNTTVTGFVNASSYGTFGGTVNAASLNVSGVTGSGNTTVTGFINASSYGTFGGTVNAASLNVSGVTGSGNTTVTGFVNVSSYGTFGGTVNAASLNISGVVATGNTTITGSLSASAGVATRVVAITDATSITINADTTDVAKQTNTQAVGTLTVNAPTGTLADGQKIVLRLQSTNVQTFSWNAIFVGSTDLALPTASSGASKYDYIGFIYNSTATKWHLLAKTFGF